MDLTDRIRKQMRITVLWYFEEGRQAVHGTGKHDLGEHHDNNINDT
jgi:hypothetical protein